MTISSWNNWTTDFILKKKEKEESEKGFSVGQRVRIAKPLKHSSTNTKSLEGILITYGIGGDYFVDFGKGFDGHDGNGLISTNTGWWCTTDELEAAGHPQDGLDNWV